MQGNIWTHNAPEPSGAAYHAAGPVNTSLGLFVLVYIFFLIENGEVSASFYQSHRLWNLYSSVQRHIWHILELLPFFVMDYLHLQKCPRVTQSQGFSFIAKNAYQEFCSKTPLQVHILDGLHRYIK